MSKGSGLDAVAFKAAALSIIETLFVAIIGLVACAATSNAGSLMPGDPEAGEQVYTQCIGCHSLDRNRTGPRHCGLIGRKAGSLSGFEYSEAMRISGLVWDVDTLDQFLADPFEYVPGTNMGFAGIDDPMARRNLIAYLVKVNRSGGECNKSF